MDTFEDETEYDAFIRSIKYLPVPQYSDIQQMVKLGILTPGVCCSDWEHELPRVSHRNCGGGLKQSLTTSSSFGCQHHCNCSGGSIVPRSKLTVQNRETAAERRARLLQQAEQKTAEKRKEKAEKKRLKKKKQKERKQLEKLKKEKENPVKSEEQLEEEEEEKECKDDGTNSCVSTKDSDSSDEWEDEATDEDDAINNSDDPEELDMTSTFVSKAAMIANQKLEQRAKTEKVKPKTSETEAKVIPENPKDVEDERKDSAAASFHDNKKKSTELASIGYRFASAGDFNMAVKYFTDAIKYNPTEFKLFGNRAYCFERMQEYMKALTDAELSLSMCPGWVKGLFRKGRALAGLKRYEEAVQAFTDVLKLDASCTEAAQELMRVQITQLMEHGFSREQSSNALIIHGTVKKAVEVLCKLNGQPAIPNGTLPLAQVANASGVSPVLSANINPPLPHSRDAAETQFKNNPAGPVQIMSELFKSHPKPNHGPQELYPVWVGNLDYPVTEAKLTNLFSKVGLVHSIKMLTHKRCAFINFTQQEHCEEAIRHFHGFLLNGTKIAVRYPDRIPPGKGISRSALTSDLEDERGRSAVGGRRPFHY